MAVPEQPTSAYAARLAERKAETRHTLRELGLAWGDRDYDRTDHPGVFLAYTPEERRLGNIPPLKTGMQILVGIQRHQRFLSQLAATPDLFLMQRLLAAERWRLRAWTIALGLPGDSTWLTVTHRKREVWSLCAVELPNRFNAAQQDVQARRPSRGRQRRERRLLQAVRVELDALLPTITATPAPSSPASPDRAVPPPRRRDRDLASPGWRELMRALRKAYGDDSTDGQRRQYVEAAKYVLDEHPVELTAAMVTRLQANITLAETDRTAANRAVGDWVRAYRDWERDHPGQL